jgi:hypothetical protein
MLNWNARGNCPAVRMLYPAGGESAGQMEDVDFRIKGVLKN